MFRCRSCPPETCIGAEGHLLLALRRVAQPTQPLRARNPRSKNGLANAPSSRSNWSSPARRPSSSMPRWNVPAEHRRLREKCTQRCSQSARAADIERRLTHPAIDGHFATGTNGHWRTPPPEPPHVVLVAPDSDLIPAIESVRRINSAVRLIVAFPPKRRCIDLRRLADGQSAIGESTLGAVEWPPVVTAADGY